MSRSPVAEDAYRRLRAAITEQRLEPGMPLIENDLARALGISRTPIREALSRLELEGFAARDGGGRLAVLRLTPEQITDLFAVRMLLEGYGAELAAERISDAELDELDALLRRDEQALADGDFERLAELNQQIHDITLAASRNRVLVDLVTSLRQRLVGITAFAVGEAADRERFVRQHAELVALIREGDGVAAAALIRAHLAHARDLLLQGLDDLEDDDEDTLARLLTPVPPSEEG